MATEPNIKLEVLQGGAGGADAVVAASNETDPSIGQTPGQILRRERESQGLEQLDICDRLRLQLWVVEALEEDEYHRLAAPTYARGYLCNYANLLELPEAQVLAAYELVRADKPASAANAKRMVSGSETRPAGADGPSKWAPMVGLGLLFGIVGLFAAWWFGDRGALNGSELPTYASSTDVEVSDAPELNSYANGSMPAVDEPGEDDFANGVAVSDGVAVTGLTTESALASAAGVEQIDSNLLVDGGGEQETSENFSQSAGVDSDDLDAEMLAAAQAEAAFEARQFSGQSMPAAVGSLSPRTVAEPAPQSVGSGPAAVRQPVTIDGVPLARTYAVTEPVVQSQASVSTGGLVTSDYDSGSSYVAPVNDGKTSVSLYFQQDSWAEIRDANGSKLVYRLGQAGSTADVRGYPPFRVFLGNSPGVEVQLNGSPYDTSQHHRPNNTARFQIGADS